MGVSVVPKARAVVKKTSWFRPSDVLNYSTEFHGLERVAKGHNRCDDGECI